MRGRRALLAQARVDALHRVAHALHALADLRRAARLLGGRAQHLLRDVPHRARAAQHALVSLVLRAARLADLADPPAHALDQVGDVDGRAALLAHGLHDLPDPVPAAALGKERAAFVGGTGVHGEREQADEVAGGRRLEHHGVFAGLERRSGARASRLAHGPRGGM